MSFSTYRLNYLCTCGGSRSYGKTLYIFGGSSQNYSSPSNSKSLTEEAQHKQTDSDSLVDKEESKRRLQQLEKVHHATLLEKEETIVNLKDVLLKHERRVLELENGLDEKINSRQNQTAEDRTHSSPVQKLLDQIDRLQKENDTLLRKVSDFEAKEASIDSLAVGANEEISEQSELPYQMESCTTDTEKELAKIKRIKHSMDLEMQKLRRENAQLRDRLTSYGVKTSDLITTSVMNTSSNAVGQTSGSSNSNVMGNDEYQNDIRGSSVGNQIQHLQQELENNITDFNYSRLSDRERKKLEDIYARFRHTISLVFKEFLEVKSSYLALKNDVKSFQLPLGEHVKELQLQVQETLTNINDKYKEVVEKYLREMKLRKKYHNELVALRGNIRVLCRVRPWIKEDGPEDDTFVVTLDAVDDTLIKINNKGRTQFFDVDKAFGTDSTQDQIFEEVSSLIRSVIDGYNVCIFAYGQTGSGKTYTMEGPSSNPGINQRALQLLFKETVDENWQYEISASVLEIYNEVIRDLLNPDQDCRLEVKMKPEGGLHVPGLITVPVTDLATVNELFETGKRNRAMASTNMNEHSSRSHCLLCVTVTGYNSTTGSKSVGRLNLVDLAGSERVSKSMADGIHLKEAQNINKSLSCLGDVIHALRNKQSHVPYRNSKLTYLLQESLGGDSKTLMIVQVAPVEKNVSETVCSLVFGQRARSVELGTASKNIFGNKNAPAKRPSSLFTSSSSLSASLSSPSLISPVSNQSPSPNLSPSPSSSNHSFLTSSLNSLSSPTLTGRKLPPSPASLRSPSTSTPTMSRKLIFNSKMPSPQLSGKRKPTSSSQTSLNSSPSPTPKKPLLGSRSPTVTVRKLPTTPAISTSPVASKVQSFR